ncbi:hypothetical protein Lal_00000615 [Lupinus albus]|nr:hypothetical protein Lal_00000615 [Lupinus albus]
MPQLNRLKVGKFSQNKDKKPACIKRSQQMVQGINKFQISGELEKWEGSSAQGILCSKCNCVRINELDSSLTFHKKVRILGKGMGYYPHLTEKSIDK